MNRNAAVVVIGGGVIGTSIAYHLARAGVSDVIVVDRSAQPGEGSTGKATGGFRAQFATAVNVRLSLLSRDELLRFEDETGVDPGYRQVGYLWLASTQEELHALRLAREVQRAEGLHEAIELKANEVREHNPLVEDDDIVGGAFCHTDGYIRPLEILRGYRVAAERLGVRFLWGEECSGFDTSDDGSINAVSTTNGRITADFVVNAAGPWAARIAALADVSLPVVPLRRQAAITVPTDLVPADMPMTIFMHSGFHLRARDGRAMICWPHPEKAGEPRNLRADPKWIDTVTTMARERVPVLRTVDIDRDMCYAGLYEMSPDHHAILGLSPHSPNLYFANGSSGHGVMHSPAIGSIIAAMITGEAAPLDVTELRPSRFDEGQPVAASELL